MTENTQRDELLAAGLAAFAHLQSAALEVIAALRATLDVAEDLLKDPSFLSAGSSVAGVVTRIVETVEPLIQRPDHQVPGDEGPVEHIRVS